MDLWISKNNPQRQTIIAIACAAAGMALMIAARDYSALDTNTGAGFLLGTLLMILGAAGFFVSGRQKITVDPASRRITIEDSNLFGRKSRLIPFDQIEDIRIGYLGKKSNFVKMYYLALKLRSGEEYPLFAPGRFFEGCSDRSTVEGWQRRLYEYFGQRL